MAYTLGQAALATGKAKPTILAALQKGKISGTRNEHDHWQIDPAELHRVYPAANGQDTTSPNDAEPKPERVLNPHMQAVEAERDGLKAQLGLLERERDELSRRLDEEAIDRRSMALLLTDQRKRRSWLEIIGLRRREG